jgi:hypothetical protein
MGRELIKSAMSLFFGVLSDWVFWVSLLLLTPFTAWERYAPQHLRHAWNIGLSTESASSIAVSIFVVLIFRRYHRLRLGKVELEEQLRPKIELVFGAGHPFEQDSPNVIVPGRTFRVGVRNLCGKNIDQVSVEIERLEPNSDPPLAPPLPLQRMHDRSTADDVPARTFSLAPHRTEYIDVLFKPFHQEGAIVCHVVSGIVNLIRPGRYNLGLNAYAREGAPHRRRIEVVVPVGTDMLSFSPQPQHGE